VAHNVATVRAGHYYYDTGREDWEYRQAEAGGAGVFVTYGQLYVNRSTFEFNVARPRFAPALDQPVGGGAVTIKGGKVRYEPARGGSGTHSKTRLWTPGFLTSSHPSSHEPRVC